MIKAIIFDFYGVICYEIGLNWYKTRPPKEVVAELKEKYDLPSDVGEISEEEFFEGIASSVGLTGKEVREEWLSAAKINRELVEYIRQLKTTYKIAVCTNTTPNIFREILHTNHIESVFDVVVSSSEVRMVKPHADIYKFTLKELDAEPGEAVFIDDREPNVIGAKTVGIKSFVYKDVEKLKTDLKKVV